MPVLRSLSRSDLAPDARRPAYPVDPPLCSLRRRYIRDAKHQAVLQQCVQAGDASKEEEDSMSGETTLDDIRQWPTKRLRRPRWWARLQARLGGYFWLPCDVCGQWSGGQEWHGDGYTTGPGRTKGVC